MFDTDDQNEAEIRGFWKTRGGYDDVKLDEAVLLRQIDRAREALSGYGGHLGWCLDKNRDVEPAECQCGWIQTRTRADPVI